MEEPRTAPACGHSKQGSQEVSRGEGGDSEAVKKGPRLFGRRWVRAFGGVFLGCFVRVRWGAQGRRREWGSPGTVKGLAILPQRFLRLPRAPAEQTLGEHPAVLALERRLGRGPHVSPRCLASAPVHLVDTSRVLCREVQGPCSETLGSTHTRRTPGTSGLPLLVAKPCPRGLRNMISMPAKGPVSSTPGEVSGRPPNSRVFSGRS